MYIIQIKFKKKKGENLSLETYYNIGRVYLLAGFNVPQIGTGIFRQNEVMVLLWRFQILRDRFRFYMC